MMESVALRGVKLEVEEETDLGNFEVRSGVDPEAGPPNVDVEYEGSLALVVREAAEENVEKPNKPKICAATAKAKRLACLKTEHEHLRKKKYKGFPRKREQYGIDADSGALQNFHRGKLRLLLKSLMEQRRWTEACGVIGVLLSIPFSSKKDNERQGCRSDYWGAMTVLRRVEDTQASAIRCRRMFRLLNRHQPNARCRGEVQLESALYLINQGDREAAYNELRPLADGLVFRDDPVVNLCHGINTYCLWYEAAVTENLKQDVAHVRADSEGRSSGPQEVMGETEAPESSAGLSSGTNRFLGGSTERFLRGGSPEGSVFSSDSHLFRGAGQQTRHSSQEGIEVDASVWQASQRSIYEETDDDGFLEGGEQVWLKAIVPLSSEMDRRLFPIRVLPHPLQRDQHYRVAMNDGRTRDLHAAAVKHLKQALQSAPDMLPALLPLVQLLLAVDDVKGAVYEIDRCAQALKNHITPPSIKAVLLESLKHTDHLLLKACYQKVLLINPFALWALKGLINLFTSGKLQQKVLLDSIVLHLDATSGSVEVWRKLASILLEVGKAFGVILLEAGMEAGVKTEDTNTDIEETPSVVSREYIQRLWSSPRHQWWLKKHFNAEAMQKHQQQSGDRWLIAHKASCAAHIYGPQFVVVERVCTYLEKKGEDPLLKFVRRHRLKSLKLFAEQYSAD